MSNNKPSTAQDIAANTLLAVMFLFLFGVAIHLAVSDNEESDCRPRLENPGY